MRLLGRTLGASIRITTAASRDAGVALVDPAALEAADPQHRAQRARCDARGRHADHPHVEVPTSRRRRARKTICRSASYAMLAIQDTGTRHAARRRAARVRAVLHDQDRRHAAAASASAWSTASPSSRAARSRSRREVGRGTTVILYLPLTKNEPRAAAPPALPVTPPVVAHTVLVVEDEAAVRSTVRRQLETLGHTVLVADTAAAALPMLKGRSRRDVMVTDVVLGSGMNGIDLAGCRARVPARVAGDFHVGLHGGAGSAAAHQRQRRAAVDQAVDALSIGARAERRYAGSREDTSRS